MEEILDRYQGKLYSSDQIKKWDLPKGILNSIDFDNHDYFFLATSTEAKDHGEKHVHHTIYPSKYDIVYLLNVETSIIIPQLLHDCLDVINKEGLDLITSTGFCKQENLCYFGVFFSVARDLNADDFLGKVKKIEK